MKYVVLVPDGMADYPLDELGGRTPLEAARTPHMDFLVQNGKLAMANFVPEGMKPGSDVANLAIFGYNPRQYYAGRAPFEAMNLGIVLAPDEIAFRCNFVTVEDNILIDYSAGHITTKEAQVLIKFLNKKLKSAQIRFTAGVSYRHLMIFSGAESEQLLSLKCTAPHDITGKPIAQHMPSGNGAKTIATIMEQSRQLLAEHEINLVRVDLKENPASMIWLWGQGKRCELPQFKQKYGLSGAVISAVDLIKGIGRAIGLEPILVPGATGYYDTDYEAKARYALESLKTSDFVFVHVEAPDEAGHNGDTRAKISAIESFDRLIVGPMLEELKKRNESFRMMVLPDHPTPVALKTHTAEPVCVAIYGEDVAKDEFMWYNENEAKKSSLVFENGYELMDCFVSRNKI